MKKMTNEQIQDGINKINEREEELTAKILDAYYSAQEHYKIRKISSIINGEVYNKL